MAVRPAVPGSIELPRGWRLEWTGRWWRPGRLAGACAENDRTGGSNAGLRTIEACGEGSSSLVFGDALDVGLVLARGPDARAVDIVYVDPPYSSQVAYCHEARLDGPADGRVVRAPAYDDRWDEASGAYLDMLAPRLEVLASLLAPTGSIWVHVDWRASYLVRILLDEILGPSAFKNEIVWRRAPNLGRQAASHQFGRTLDTIVVYGGERANIVPPMRLELIEPSAMRWDADGRPFTCAPRGDYTDASIEKLERDGRVHRTASGKVYIKYFLMKNGDGQWCRERRIDALWTDVAPLRHSRKGERTGFPTQKPRALVDRIISCASPPGGLVVDLFAGSGTTGESAHALGRRFVLGDSSPLALTTARARLLRAGVSLRVQSCGDKPLPEREAPEVRVEPVADGLRIELVAPSEPLAWAVLALDPVDGCPRTIWHSERVPGTAPVAALRFACVPRTSGSLIVRAHHDDGGVGTRILENL
ncbi:MAG: site-specific DNA-methyltransferase [Polyangiaceae bacterium]